MCSAMKFKLCLIVTDAISFNVLYRGQLEYLTQRGFELTLICGGAFPEIEKLRSRKVGTVIDLGLVRRPQPWLDLLSLLKLVWHLTLHRYDLVVTSTPKALLLGSVAAFITAQSRRIAFFQGRVYENFDGLRRRIYRFLDLLTIACVHEALFVSKSLLAEFLKELPTTSTKGHVLASGSGNGVCTQTFSPNAVSATRLDAIRNVAGIRGSEFVVLVIGRMCRDKGLTEVADVVRRVSLSEKEVRFILVGSSEDNDAREQLQMILGSGIATHVEFTPDVVPYFALADLHLFLTHREGFGNVAIEAAAMGVPTFAFDVVGVRDSVAKGISGNRFSVGDTKSVATAILSLCCDRESMQKEFSGAREWVNQHFLQAYVWKNYADFYMKKKKND